MVHGRDKNLLHFSRDLVERTVVARERRKEKRDNVIRLESAGALSRGMRLLGPVAAVQL
jgi:hypothetical protein